LPASNSRCLPLTATRTEPAVSHFYAERNLVEHSFNAITALSRHRDTLQKKRAALLPDCTWFAHSFGSNDDRPGV